MPTALETLHRPNPDLTDEEYIAFLKQRPSGERWQLIDGEAIMMNPPRVAHQWIGSRLATHLNIHFLQHRPELCAVQEIGLLVPGVARFRPQADVAVIDDKVDFRSSWADRFQLVTEIVSESNTPEQIERKRRRYMQHAHNLYVLKVEQIEVRVDVWARRTGWRKRTLASLDGLIELPEFDISLPLGFIYSGTPLARREPDG